MSQLYLWLYIVQLHKSWLLSDAPLQTYICTIHITFYVVNYFMPNLTRVDGCNCQSSRIQSIEVWSERERIRRCLSKLTQLWYLM